MKHRITRLPMVQLALVAVSVLVGLALVPVAAQTAASLDGQVVVRSDGAVYLIQNGQRRWVATVVINDDELNAYPEAEPIYTALAPFGGGGASSGSTAAQKPAAPASPAAAAAPPASSAPAASSASGAATPGTTPTIEPGSMVAPTGGNCPGSHQVKGATTGTEKWYYEPDRPEYPNITPEACFVAGSYARDAGYKNSKQR
jgi:hypothetical protein